MSIENASYRRAFAVLCFGVLLSVMYRGYTGQGSSWDLLALVVVSSGTAVGHQAAGRILSRSWLLKSVMAAAVAIAVATLAAWLR